MFEYTVEIDEIYQPTLFLKDADFVRFGFNISAIENKMNSMGYLITPEFVDETFQTSIL